MIRRILKLSPHTRADARAELSDEFEHHLALREAELMRAGLSREEARAEARRACGDVDAALSRCLREDLEKMETSRRTAKLDELRQDLRFAWRQLLRDPAFALLAVTTLALGIGLNAAVFTMVDALFLKRLPYPAPDRLVAVRLAGDRAGEFQGADPRSLERVRERATEVGEFASWSGWSFNLTGNGPAEALDGAVVTANFFDVIGVQPLHGRGFNKDDLVPGQRTAILSYGLWQRRFAGDPGIVGSAINIDDAIPRFRATGIVVVGIMPEGFAFPTREAQVWLPMVYEDGQAPTGFGTDWFGRLRPGVSLAQAQARMQSAIDDARSDHPELGRGFGLDTRVVPLRNALVGQFRTAALILFAAVTFVLLIACANVANLLLTRSTGRSTELAVRASLGASRLRIVRQLLTENLLLAIVAALLGLALAWVALKSVTGILPAAAVSFTELRVDARVLAYTMTMGMVTVLLFGALPALRLPFDRAFDALKASGRANSATGARRTALRTLIAGEVALAVVLGVGALLMLQSFWRLRHENVGFAAEGVLSLKVSPPRHKYPPGESRHLFFTSALERVKTIPGVSDAAAIQILPLGGNNWNPRMVVEGRVYPAPDDQPEVDWRSATLDYFSTMRVPLLAGRTFTIADDARAPAVALVNQTLVKRVFGNENPIGRRVSTNFEGPGSWVTIVGVVGDTRDQSVGGEARPQFYRPHAQYAISPMSMLVRVNGEPMQQAEDVQQTLRQIEPDVVISDVQPMNSVIGDSVAQPRLLTALLTLFGGLAVLLGAIGIYGVMAYAVGQRKQEMGIRAALGARPSDLLRMVLGEGVQTALIGTVLGVVGALLLSSALEAQLYQVQSLDPLSYGLVALLVLLVALAASLVPARRAGSLRQDALLREP